MVNLAENWKRYKALPLPIRALYFVLCALVLVISLASNAVVKLALRDARSEATRKRLQEEYPHVTLYRPENWRRAQWHLRLTERILRKRLRKFKKQRRQAILAQNKQQ